MTSCRPPGRCPGRPEDLELIGFTDLDLDRRIASVSGGEAVLLAFAGLPLAEPDVLLLDEPTNNLTAALSAYQGTLLVASHDEPSLADLRLAARLDLTTSPASLTPIS